MNLHGILLTPTGVPMASYSVYLIATVTSPSVLQHVEASFVTDSNGAYSFDAPLGRYRVFVRNPSNSRVLNIGSITITPDTVIDSVNELIMVEAAADSGNPILAQIGVVIEGLEGVQTAVESASESAGAASSSATVATEAQSASSQSASDAQTHADRAEEAGALAESAASMAAAFSNPFPNTTDGLANTSGTGATNRFFSVPGTANTLAIAYRNDAGAATEIGRAPSGAALNNLWAVSAGLPSLNSDPNLWANHYFDKLLAAAASSSDVDGNFSAFPGSLMSLLTVNGRRAFRLTSNTTGEQPRRWRQKISAYDAAPGDSVVATCRITDRVGSSALSRILLRQYNAAGAEITAVRQTYAIPAAGSFVDGTIVALTAVLDATCFYTEFHWGVGATADGYTVDLPMFSKGTDTGYRPAPLPKPVFYVSPTGSDIGTGFIDSPFATLDRAIRAAGGVGLIHWQAGVNSDMTLDVAQVKDIEILPQFAADFSRPVVKFGSPLTGITKTSGQTKVYQAAKALTGQPNWIWLDDVPDAETLISPSEYHPYHRGRTHRLPCTRIRKTIATTLAAALAEIDATSAPLCFYDAGTLYFSVPGGADATTGHNIYVTDQSNKFLKNAPLFWSSVNRLKITGVEIRYGLADFRSLRGVELFDIRSVGSPLDGISWAGNAKVQLCEGCGAGSAFESGTTGDGGNVHNFQRGVISGNYWHDNNDDGFSPHENCHGTSFADFAEYNMGSGLTPALGANWTLINPVTRKNAVDPRYISTKLGGVESHHGPSGGGDPGNRTMVLVIGGVDYGSKNGFADRKTTGGTEGYMRAIGCKSHSPVEIAFNCSNIEDCGHSGSGTPKAGTTQVSNTTLVT